MDKKIYHINSYSDLQNFVVSEVLSYFTIGEIDKAYQENGTVAIINDGKLVDLA